VKIAFAGTPQFGALVLGALLHSRHDVALVFTQPDRPAGRGRALRQSPVKQLAVREGLRVEQPERISTPEYVEELRSLGIEALTVAAFGQILKAPLLGGLPCINVHASLLPRYRGAAPIERAIMAGEKVTGVSIMDITPKVDTGAVYLQRQIAIADEDDAGSMYLKLGKAGGEALAEVISGIESGTASSQPQEENAATYVEKITAADMEISWRDPAEKIALQVRALSPHIGAYTNADSRRLKVWRAKAVEAEAFDTESGYGVPSKLSGTSKKQVSGSVIVSRQRLLVVCGTGFIEILEVQPEGKRRMTASEFLRGHRRLESGNRLE